MSLTLSLFLCFLLAFFSSLALTPLVRRLALATGTIDTPGDPRRIHRSPIPRLGGIALFLSFTLSVLVFVPSFAAGRDFLTLILAGSVILAVGVIDDRFGVGPWWKLLWQIGAAVILITSGIGISAISSPLGGVINLDSLQLNFAGYGISLLADLFTIFWIVAIVNTVNFLDGLDGLATGVGGIAALIIAGLALGSRVDQPETALIALALAGAAFGFLPYNFYPARIFLADSGSMFMGFILASLAVISGSKIATAILVLGFPMLDVAWAIIRRSVRGVSPFQADRYHLHHRLLGLGLSQSSAVLLMYLLSFLFGAIALFATSGQKLIMILLITISTLLFLAAVLRLRQKSPKSG